MVWVGVWRVDLYYGLVELRAATWHIYFVYILF